MHANPDLHGKIIRRADESFVTLVDQIDALFQNVALYLQDNPPDSSYSCFYLSRDLFRCVENLTTLPVRLSSVVSRWKESLPRELDYSTVEQDILIEIWANSQALIYFLRSHDSPMEDFSDDTLSSALFHLIKANRTLT